MKAIHLGGGGAEVKESGLRRPVRTAISGAMAQPAVQPSFTVEGDRLTMLDTGPRRLDALIDLIERAERTLRVIYYIYVDDQAGARVRQALIDAAARGVAVSLIVDGLGSELAEQHRFFDPLRDAGADVCRFVPR